MEIIFWLFIILISVMVIGSLLLGSSLVVYYLLVIWPFTAVVAAIVIGIITESALMGLFWGVVIGVVGWGINRINTNRTARTAKISVNTQVKDSLPDITRQRVEVELEGTSGLQMMLNDLRTDYEMMVDSNEV